MQYRTIPPHGSIILYLLSVNTNLCVNKNYILTLIISV